MQTPHNSKEHYKEQAIREQLMDLDFKEEFIEKILKEYSTKKIDEKLDLLMERKNIQSPIGWLSAALKNDYLNEEQERHDEGPVKESGDDKSKGTMYRALNESGQMNSSHIKNTDSSEQVYREKAIKAIKLIQDNLSACISHVPSGKRTRAREGLL